MDLTKEIDGTPLLEAFNFTREKVKAMHGLKGILCGITADKRLNEKEFLFLDCWLKSQQFLAQDQDVVGILTQVGDILEDGEVSREELHLMQSKIATIASTKDTGSLNKIGQIDELIGFLTGVAADGVLNDDEVSAMSFWLEENASIRATWPASVVVNRLELILEDGIITEEERSDLLNTVNQVTGTNAEDSKISFESTEVWEDKIDKLVVAGAMFCLTGDFVSGDRNSMDNFLRFRGANTSSNVNKDVDFLVIGTLASGDWLYTSHGRKIEKALMLKREGHHITIITERTLLKFTR